ncbi:MAG: 50S ribosomal protein L5 [Thermoprotei archaeon]|nr:MAG: 50S ribosomal protein L5 [Thermoprotei archaeon]
MSVEPVFRNGCITVEPQQLPSPAEFKSSVLSPSDVERILVLWKGNRMRIPRIAKVTVNMGVGTSGERLDKAVKVLSMLTGQEPSIRRARRTIKEFGISRGEPIAAVTTLRGAKAYEFLKKAFYAVNYTLKLSSFDPYGNVAFGIAEHIAMPGVRYDPDLGIFGMDVAITMERPGFRIVRRKRCRTRSIPRRHRVTREEAILLLELLFNVRIVPR